MNFGHNNTALLNVIFSYCDIHLVMGLIWIWTFYRLCLCMKESCQLNCPLHTHRTAGVEGTCNFIHIRNCMRSHENNFPQGKI